MHSVPNVVRTIDAYREARGPYDVDRGLAQHIAEATLFIVGKHTGSLALEGVRGIAIATDANPIAIDTVRIPSSTYDHQLILTRRDIKGVKGEVLGHAQLESYTTHGRVINSKTMVTTYPATQDPQGGLAVKTAVHEVGHTFGLKHCACNGCIMYYGSYKKYGNVEQYLYGDIFCDDCAGDLEIAGHMELAAKL